MDLQQFSVEFDIFWNNVTSNQAPGLSEFEKSIFLTKSQEELVKNYFNPAGNKYQEGFDDSAKRQQDFSKLICHKTMTAAVNSPFNRHGKDFAVSEKQLFIVLNEQLFDRTNNKLYVVKPLSYEEYDRLMQKPYKLPIKGQAWRLIVSNDADVPAESKNSHMTYDEIYSTEAGYVNAFNALKTSIGNPTMTIATPKGYPVNVTIRVDADFWDYEVPEEEDYFYYIYNLNKPEVREIRNDTKIQSVDILITLPVNSLYSPALFLQESLQDAGVLEHLSNCSINPLGSLSQTLLHNFLETWKGLDSIQQLFKDSVVNDSVEGGAVYELIGNFADNADLEYTVRYIRKPQPIILTDLDDGLTIDGFSTATDCELSEHLHREILQRAVELAKAAWSANGEGSVNVALEMGKRSE